MNIPRRSRLYRPSCMPRNASACNTSSATAYPSPTNVISQQDRGQHQGTLIYWSTESTDVTNLVGYGDDTNNSFIDESYSNSTKNIINFIDPNHTDKNTSLPKTLISMQEKLLLCSIETISNVNNAPRDCPSVLRDYLSVPRDYPSVPKEHPSSSHIPLCNIPEEKKLSRGRLQNKLRPNSFLSLSGPANIAVSTDIRANERSTVCSNEFMSNAVDPCVVQNLISPSDDKRNNLVEEHNISRELVEKNQQIHSTHIIYWAQPFDDKIVINIVPSPSPPPSTFYLEDKKHLLSVSIPPLTSPLPPPTIIPNNLLLSTYPIYQSQPQSLLLPPALPLSLPPDLSDSILDKKARKHPLNNTKSSASQLRKISENSSSNSLIEKKMKKKFIEVFDASNLEKLKYENLDLILSQLLHSNISGNVRGLRDITNDNTYQERIEDKKNCIQRIERRKNVNENENEKNKENICDKKMNENKKKRFQKIIDEIVNQKEPKMNIDNCITIPPFCVVDKRKNDEILPICFANRSRIASSVYTETVTGVTYTTKKVIGKGAFGYAVLASISESKSRSGLGSGSRSGLESSSRSRLESSSRSGLEPSSRSGTGRVGGEYKTNNKMSFTLL